MVLSSTRTTLQRTHRVYMSHLNRMLITRTDYVTAWYLVISLETLCRSAQLCRSLRQTEELEGIYENAFYVLLSVDKPVANHCSLIKRVFIFIRLNSF